ncbi:MAG: glycosyltransferase family 2 protein [Brevinema sp.]
MNNPCISIIIPVYNTESYLPKCLESAINQSFQNIEIIVVDDGSQGNCQAICSQYSQVIYTTYEENKGLFYAREHGTRLAKGEIIVHLDSDDWLPLDICEHIAHAGDFDLLLSEVISVYPHHHEKSSWANKGLKKVGSDFFELYCQRQYISWAMWGKAFNRELALQVYDALALKEHLIMSEDYLFFTIYASLVKNPKALFHTGYYYNVSNESVNRTEITLKKLEKHFQDLKIVVQSAQKTLKNSQSSLKNLETELLNVFLSRFIDNPHGSELLSPFILPIIQLYGEKTLAELTLMGVENQKKYAYKIARRIENVNFPFKKSLMSSIRILAGKIRSFWATK